jgi:hypothetical protein
MGDAVVIYDCKICKKYGIILLTGLLWLACLIQTQIYSKAEAITKTYTIEFSLFADGNVSEYLELDPNLPVSAKKWLQSYYFDNVSITKLLNYVYYFNTFSDISCKSVLTRQNRDYIIETIAGRESKRLMLHDSSNNFSQRILDVINQFGLGSITLKQFMDYTSSIDAVKGMSDESLLELVIIRRKSYLRACKYAHGMILNYIDKNEDLQCCCKSSRTTKSWKLGHESCKSARSCFDCTQEARDARDIDRNIVGLCE